MHSVETQDRSGTVQSASGGRFWPLSWWQILLALAVMSHVRGALDWAVFPSTASRPFLENLVNLEQIGHLTLRVTTHFIAVGAAMALVIRSIKGTVDLRSLLSWLLILPAPELMSVFIHWSITHYWYESFKGTQIVDWSYKVYFSSLLGRGFTQLVLLIGILALVAKFGGRVSWLQSVFITAAGVVASYAYGFLWLGTSYQWDIKLPFYYLLRIQ